MYDIVSDVVNGGLFLRFNKMSDVQKDKRKPSNHSDYWVSVVEVTGFEPATFWSRTKRATKLRYTSKDMEPMKGLEPLTC